MGTADSLERVANTAILAGFSLAMIKQLYPLRVYEREKARRAKKRKQRRK